MKQVKFVEFIFRALSLACSVAALTLLIMNKGELNSILKIIAFALVCNGIVSVNVREEKG